MCGSALGKGAVAPEVDLRPLLAIGLPLYLIPLGIRIRQENVAMRNLFAGY
jgi:hypothetical protein